MRTPGVPASILSVVVQARGIAKTNAELLGTQRNLERARKAAKWAAVGIAASLLYAGKVAIDFEAAFADVEKTVDASAKGYARLERGIRDMSKEIPTGADELARLAGVAGQLGIKERSILKFTRVVADLGETTNLQGEAAATTLARIANIMGTSERDYGRLGSTIVELGNNLATTEAEITEMALRLAKTGKQIGLSESDVLAFAGALSSVGIEAQAGGSSFARAFIEMAQAIDTGGGKLQLFAETAGMSVGQFKTQFERDAALAMVAFTEGLGRINKEGGSVFQTLDKLGLSEIRVRDALLGAAGSGDLFREALKRGNAEWGRNTALTIEANKRYRTTEARLEIMKNKALDWARGLGQELLPALNEMMDVLDDPSLDAEEKFKRIADVGIKAISDGLEQAANVAADAGPEIVASLASGMARAWSDMNPLAKLFTVGVLIRAVGGKGAILRAGGAVGALFGAGVSAGAAAGVAGGAGGGAAGGAAAGGAAGVLAKLKAARWARIGGLAVGALIGDQLIRGLGDKLDEGSDDLRTRLEGLAGAGAFDFDPLGILGGKGDVAERSMAKNLIAQLDEMESKRVKLSAATERSLRAQAAELDLTKEQRRQLDHVFKLTSVGRRLGVKVDLGVDPEKLRQLEIAFGGLRGGVFTSMEDIQKVVKRNMGIVRSELGGKSAEGRKLLAQNFRAAAEAIRQAIDSGAIPKTKQGLAKIESLIRSAKLVSGQDPLGIAKGFADSWEKAEGINSRMVREMIADLGKMPKPARQKAVDAMLAYARGLVQAGKIPLDDFRDFRSKLLSEFDGLRAQGGKKADALAERLSESFGTLNTNVGSALEGVIGNTRSALAALGVKGAIKGFALKNPDFVYSTKPSKNLAEQSKQDGGFIVPGTGSGDTFRTALAPGWFIMNREATSAYGFNRGGKVPVALEPGERAFPPHEVRAMGGAGTLERMNREVPRFQKGGEIGKPQLSGPAGPLLDGGRAAIDQVHKAAVEYVAKHRPKGSPGGAAFGPKGVGSYKGVPMANWVIESLMYAASKGASPQPTSGYRSHAYNVAQGRNYKSEHEGTQYPYGAVDFGGYTSGYAAKMSVVNATRDFKYPLLAPIGFEDDGHASGTGHQLGGVVRALQALAEGGWVKTGYTTYSGSGGGAGGNLQSGAGFAELGSATSTGALSEPGHLAAALGRGTLPMDFPIDLKIGSIGKVGRLYKRDRGYGDGNSHYSVDIHDKAFGLVGLSGHNKGDAWVRPAGGAGGEATEAMKKQAEGKARKANYEAKLRNLRQRVADSKSVPAKQSALWRLMSMWGRVGIFDKGERAHILDRVQAAAAQGKPEGTVKVLSHLASYARKTGEVTGQDPDNWHSLTDAIEKARERGQTQRERTVKRHAAARQRKIARIAARGNFPALAKMLERQEGAYNVANQSAEKLVALEPEEVTDAYVGQERGAWGSVLEQLGGWRDKTVGARDFAEHKKMAWQAEIDSIRAFNVPGIKQFMRYFHKHKWRIAPLREAISNANTFVEDRHSELGDLQGFGGPQGKIGPVGEGTPWWLTLGGPGARIFDTQNTIRELALKVGKGDTDTGPSETDRERADLLEKLLRERNLADAVTGRQGAVMKQWDQMRQGFGFAGMFEHGGMIPAGMWGVAGEKGRPEIVAGPATVFSNDQSREMFGGGDGGSGDIEVSLTIKGDVVPAEGVDPSEVAEILVRNPRTREVLRRAVLGGQGTGVRTPGDRGRRW